jgi:hypothetical protein
MYFQKYAVEIYSENNILMTYAAKIVVATFCQNNEQNLKKYSTQSMNMLLTNNEK